MTMGRLLREVTLHAGDAIVLIHGVHAIRVLEDMQAISVKQGPFLGDASGQSRRGGPALIPVFEPEVREDEIQAVVHALGAGRSPARFGEALREFEERVRGVRRARVWRRG